MSSSSPARARPPRRVTLLPRRSRPPRRTSSSSPTSPSPSRTRPSSRRARSPTTRVRRTLSASSVRSAARPALPVSARSVPRPRLRRLPTLRNRGHDLLSFPLGVVGFAMTAALCRQNSGQAWAPPSVAFLLAGRETKSPLVVHHDTTFMHSVLFH